MLSKSENPRWNENLNPISLAVSGKYNGLAYDGIKVIPLLEKGKIRIAVEVNHHQLKTVADVDFPAREQTRDCFQKILKRAIGKSLQVLI